MASLYVLLQAQAVQVLRSVFSNRFVISLLNEPLRMVSSCAPPAHCNTVHVPKALLAHG